MLIGHVFTGHRRRRLPALVPDRPWRVPARPDPQATAPRSSVRLDSAARPRCGASSPGWRPRFICVTTRSTRSSRCSS